MPRRNRLWHRKGANDALPTPKTPLDQQASSELPPSIDNFVSEASPQSVSKDDRWSFSSHTSKHNSIYLDGGEKSAGTSQEQGPKKRPKRPTPLLSKEELDYVEDSAPSGESEMPEMPQPEPMPRRQKSQKTRSKAEKKTKKNNDVGRRNNHTQIEDSSSQELERSNEESCFGRSRTPSSKVELKKGEWKKKISHSSNNPDQLSQSMRNAPLSSNGDRKPMRKTRSLEVPFTRKPMRTAKFAKSVDVESTDPSPSGLPARQKLVSLSRQSLKRSKSKGNSNICKRDASLDPSDLQKPARRANVNDSLVEGVDTLMNRSDTELLRIRSKIEKMKSSRKLDEPNRSRKEVRSLDRMTIKQNKPSRRMTNKDTSDDKEQTVAIKDNLGGSLPGLPLDSSLGQEKKKSKRKSTINMDLAGNQIGTGLSVESFPSRTKTKEAMRSKSADSWEESSESELAHILSSSRQRFRKTRLLEADKGEHPDAMQMWSARLKTNKGIKSSEYANVAPECPERIIITKRSQSGRCGGLMKGSSLPDLSLGAPLDPRKKTSKPISRTSINVCSSQNGRDLSLQSFGGRVRKQKPRSVRSVDDSWMHSSESDLSRMISEGLNAFDRVDEFNESTDNQGEDDISQRSNSNLKVISGRGKSANRRKMRKEYSPRILGRSSDHSQKDEEGPLTRTAPQKTRSDGSFAKIKRRDIMGRKTPSRTTSAQHLHASSSLSPVKVDFAGEMYKSKNISEVLDDISVVLEETEKLKRIMHLETVVHMLQETFQNLDSKMDGMDFDDPKRMQTRTQILQAENEVLRTRIDQQDEALIKYKNQAANTDTTVQSVAIERESDKSAAQLSKELEGMKKKLEDKDKIIEEQTSRYKEMETEMEEVQKHTLEVQEDPTLQKRIWELEKEKTAFMTEISRLHKSIFDTSQSTLIGPESTTSVSSEQSDYDHSNQGSGLVGWLLGDRA
ncbi:MAG: hypothetical protein SGBAC_011795 [Bacillariaceae sp.]